MRIKVFGPMVSIIVSIVAIAVVVMFARQSVEYPTQNADPSQQYATNVLNSMVTSIQSSTPSKSIHRTPTPIDQNPQSRVSTSTEGSTPDPIASQPFTPTLTPVPSSTVTMTSTPDIVWSGYDEICDDMVYEGIQRCEKGPYHVVRVDPKNPHVRFEIVLPMGYDRYGNYEECRDVQVPDSIQAGESTGPGCFIDHSYPAERVGHMASRYPGAVIAFNGDFFSPSYAHGAVGLTVKNGKRLDGNSNDRNGNEIRRSSLSISTDGDVRIGPIPLDLLHNPDQPWNWVPDPDAFYSTIGGLPMLVKSGHPVDLHAQCIQEQGWCPDQYYPRARTAVGKTFNGEVIIVVVPEEWGLTIEGLAHLMVELGSEEAINLDGGGSSQLWYDGSYLYYSSRPVAEGMIVFSERMIETVDDHGINQ